MSGEVDALTRWLEDVGFTLTKVVDANEFGNVLLELERAQVSVRMAWDRGDWLLSVKSGTSDWSDIGLWTACLDGVPAAVTTTTFRDEAMLLKQRIDEIEKRGQDTGVADCLRKKGRERTLHLLRQMRKQQG